MKFTVKRKPKFRVKKAFVSEITHECAADGCQEQIPARMLMCGEHWAMVSKATQGAIWAHYTTGQELGTIKPTYTYMHYRATAILEVAAKQGKTHMPRLCPLSCGGFLMPVGSEFKCNNCSYSRPNFTVPTEQESERINNREYDSGSLMPFGRYKDRAIADLPTDYLEWMLKNLEGKRNPGLVQALENEYRSRSDAKA